MKFFTAFIAAAALSCATAVQIKEDNKDSYYNNYYYLNTPYVEPANSR